MDFAQINGARIAYLIEGELGRPVLMLSNSLMSNHTMWAPQMKALLPHFRVLRYDTRGHGESSTPPGPYSIEGLADDAASLVQHLKLDSVHFAGLSMGGMIGQQFALRHRPLLRSLLLCDTASEMPPRSMWEERIAVARAEGIEGLVDGTIKRWFVSSFIDREPASVENVRRMILTTKPEGYIACASAVRDMSQTHLLKNIRVPTHIIVGREDPACTLQASMVLHREIEGATLHIIDDAAHLSNIEKPAEFSAQMLEFLRAQDEQHQPASRP
jgi:3-oxoadipate enol-lactonase